MASKTKKVVPKDDWQDLPASGGADDWQDIPSGQKTPARASHSAGEAALAGSAQATTLGYAPQLVGGLAALADKLQPPVINPKTGARIPRTSYIQARDATANELNQIRNDQPVAYGAANMVSGLAAPVPGSSKMLSPLAIAGRGALYGALSNPGETPGEISPFQPVERVIGGGMGAVVGGTLGKAGQSIGNRARASRMASELVNPGIEQKLQGEIQDAAGKLQSEYVAPRAKYARDVLYGKEVKFNPNILENADEPGLYAALKARTPLAQKQAQEAALAGSGVKIPVNPGDEQVTLNAALADRLRRRLDKSAGFKQRNALGSPTVAKSAEETASAASSLRNLRNQVAPELQKNFDEQSYALGLKNELLDKSKSPISTLSTSKGGDNYAKLSDVDSFAGTSLRNRGEDIGRAQYLLGEDRLRRATKEGIFDYAARSAARGASQAARPLDAVINNPALGSRSISEAFIRQLVEQIARSR